jgi:hypothetical protein
VWAARELLGLDASGAALAALAEPAVLNSRGDAVGRLVMGDDA